MKHHTDKTPSVRPVSGRSVWGMVWFRFRKNKLAMAGLFLLLLMMLAILAAPLYVPYEQVVKQNIVDKFTPPCAEYWFGTDQFGRDLFARIVYGGRISLFMGLAVVAISFVAGCALGGAAGYFGGKVDSVIMRIVDMFMAIPAMLLSMAVVAALGTGVDKLLVALSISQIPRFTRVVRSSIMTLRNQEFVEAAKCCGTSSARIILKHILPNGMGPVIVSATLTLGQVILSIASLGFLGIGVSSPTPEWGTILSENKVHIRYYPYLGLIPGICIALAVMAVNFIGDGLRDALDPRTKN
ncbi:MULTISPECIES: ABC transporter permease [Intestinimonas]|jgi:peptide/nickel transport system permease protein|nr:ABC transporter permease [Intestinimonas butyriciproducens]SCI80683.1 Glutathione transport system permease protein gsiD [uncultured Clostridium sp.]MDB7816583.1 ABC transporter permease [Intestinimonas butyriciproducens]MDB7842647.1 ABC transporter permease [Intestinimonas butyriciproducens]MDB7857605.1 ABC transporter permease [Intestinimonas butyriciproducens]MDB7859647.1 ABC transporter permease [Intestinimonas butyriciproducens]